MKSGRSVDMNKLCLISIFCNNHFPIPFEGKTFAQWGIHGWDMGPGMGHWGYGMGWPGMIIMAACWIVFIVIIALFIRWIVVSTITGTRSLRQEESSLDILKKRYARGEISKEEFEEKKRDLL
jgi:putative membrane protein